MTSGPAPRRGVTLLELIVVLAILSVIAAVVTVAIGRAAPIAKPDAVLARTRTARTEAIATGRSRTFVVTSPQGVVHGTAFPDGMVVADDVSYIDALTGLPRETRR